VDPVQVLYIAIARALDQPEKAFEVRRDVEELAKVLGLEEVAQFFKEAEGMDVEDHRISLFELAPKCPPYAGYYALGEDSRERGWYMHQILTYYRAFGFDMDVRRELPDYLPAMLEFLAMSRAVDDLGRRLMRRDFYRRFIKPWLDKFVQCLEKQKSPYRHLAHALVKLLKEDFESTETT